MGLFDFFKKNKKVTDSENASGQTLYFKNGQLYKIIGDQDNWYDPKYIVSDGKMFDMESEIGINSIQIPKCFLTPDSMEGYGATGSLDYVVRMKAANLRAKGLIAESDACYRKAIVLMRASGIPYDMTPYLYFAKDLLREGRFDESEAEEEKIYKMFKTSRKKINSAKDSRPYITIEDREYYRIKYSIPDIAPKSISGYTRMKRENSENFQKLRAEAERNGIKITNPGKKK